MKLSQTDYISTPIPPCSDNDSSGLATSHKLVLPLQAMLENTLLENFTTMKF